MNTPSPLLVEIVAAILFVVALIHTFSTKFFEHLAHTHPRHAGIWHLLGEVEIVFGFWAMIMMACMFALNGKHAAMSYLESRNFTEPMFVFVIMVIAASRPILEVATSLVRTIAQYASLPGKVSTYLVVLIIVPLLGSFITEPAAMTLAALMIRDEILSRKVSITFKYATIGVLFVNISIGGVLTPFAAPPVLMVAAKWNWDIWFMVTNFGWKAVLVVVINALMATFIFRAELNSAPDEIRGTRLAVPLPLAAVHLAFLAGVIVFAHHPTVFVSLFLLFMGVASAYPKHQSPLVLREGLLVAFFLAGLVVLGGMQRWWLQPLIMAMDAQSIFLGAATLTAVTDNAALTYLGSLVEGLTTEFKTALVAGAITGGGLTIIANAPNPAGVAILREKFAEATIRPLGLLSGALPPTLVALLVFSGL